MSYADRVFVENIKDILENGYVLEVKYDEFIPPELLRRAYAADRLQLHELRARYLGEERNKI